MLLFVVSTAKENNMAQRPRKYNPSTAKPRHKLDHHKHNQSRSGQSLNVQMLQTKDKIEVLK